MPQPMNEAEVTYLREARLPHVDSDDIVKVSMFDLDVTSLDEMMEEVKLAALVDDRVEEVRIVIRPKR